MTAFNLDELVLMVADPGAENRGAEAGEFIVSVVCLERGQDVEFLEISPTVGVRSLAAHVAGGA